MSEPQQSSWPEAHYRPLPGGGHRAGGLPFALELCFTFGTLALSPRQRLYLASDHLLILTRRGFVETARRIELKDIQRLAITRTRARALFSLLFAVTALLALSLMYPLYLARTAVPNALLDLALWMALLVSLLTLVLAAVNWLAGPACSVSLTTPVAHYRLDALSRLRNAGRAVQLLLPAIHVSQGRISDDQEFSPELMVAQSAKARTAPASGHTLNPAAHMTYYALLLLIGGSALFDYFFDSPLKNTFDALLGAAIILAGCLALARQRGSDLPRDLRLLTLVTVTLLAILFYGGNIAGSTYAFVAFDAGDYDNLLAVYNPVRMFFVTSTLLLGVTGGVLGFLALARYRKQRRSAKSEVLPENLLG